MNTLASYATKDVLDALRDLMIEAENSGEENVILQKRIAKARAILANVNEIELT